METASATATVVEAFTPICVAGAGPHIDRLAELEEMSACKHDDIVTEAGWVDDVDEQYRSQVAVICAASLSECMKVG